MFRDADRIAEVARALKCAYEYTHFNDGREFRAKFVARFCKDRFAPLWEKFTDSYSRQVSPDDSWTPFADFLKDRPVAIVADFDNSRAELFKFRPMPQSQWLTLLEELNPCDIYFTDPALSFCLVFNHHDFVIAAGDAVSWAMQTFSSE